jgi:hypothetical protein
MTNDSIRANMTVARYTDDNGVMWYSLLIQDTPQMPSTRNAATVADVVKHRLDVYRSRYGHIYETVAPTVELWDGDIGERRPYDAATLAR